ncbi:hypothetical protein MMC09_005742 [Bachmanniomyces sp. S44760]|nr:hypothetical protein [Bachmanniomyces sp. S44760]
MSTTFSTVSSGSEDHPAKRMRKGTRSCLECRRRKVRCVFKPEAQVCNGCAPRRVECIDQDQETVKVIASQTKKNMRTRMGELEGMIGQILDKLDDKGEKTSSTSEIHAATALRSLQSELAPSSLLASTGASAEAATPKTVMASPNHFQNAPVFSLFDNDIFSKGSKEEDQVPHPIHNEKDARMLSAFRTLIPSRDDLTAMLKATESFWSLWAKMMPEMFEGMEGRPEDVGCEGLLAHFTNGLHSNDLAVAAKTLLCVVHCLQQVPFGFDYSRTNFPSTPGAIHDRYVLPIEALLASDEGLALSGLDAVSCMVLQSKFYLNVGKPGKAWLVNRRAMAFGQLMGVHQHLQARGKVQSETEAKLQLRKASLWMQIWQHDRIFSLILGLPYSIAECHFNSKDIELIVPPEAPFEIRMMAKLCEVTGHIIDRNHCPRNMTFASTLAIEQELEKSKEIMPDTWWAETAGPHMTLSATFEMCIAKFWYHNVRKLLHLPFMLKSLTDRRYDYSRIAALESAKEMIRYYQVFRDERRPMLHVCDVVDFEAFNASMIIIVHLLSSSSPSDPEEEAKDWELVYSVTRDLKRVCKEIPGGVANQVVRLLEDFSQARYRTCENAGEDTYEASIPYFGKIRIKWGKGYTKPRKSSTTSTSATPSDLNTQLQTPSDSTSALSASSSSSELLNTEPLVSFDSYFQPLPAPDDPATITDWQAPSMDWANMINMDLRDDWSWYINGTENGKIPSIPPSAQYGPTSF